MIGTTTAFLNDKFFEADVLLKTEEAGRFIAIEATIISRNPEIPSYIWDLSICRGKLETNEEVFEEIKKEQFASYGCSETIDVIDMGRRLEKAFFTIDDINIDFKGYTFGDTWNGWQMPYFEKSEADRLLKWLIEDGNEARYDAEKDAYLITLIGSDEEEVYEVEEVEGKRLYPIGAGCWCWDPARNEE